MALVDPQEGRKIQIVYKRRRDELIGQLAEGQLSLTDFWDMAMNDEEPALRGCSATELVNGLAAMRPGISKASNLLQNTKIPPRVSLKKLRTHSREEAAQQLVCILRWILDFRPAKYPHKQWPYAVMHREVH